MRRWWLSLGIACALVLGASYVMQNPQLIPLGGSEPAQESQGAQIDAPAARPNGVRSPGDIAIEQALHRLKQHRSVYVDIYLEIDLLDRKLNGKGWYREEWMSERKQFEFENMRFDWHVAIQGNGKRRFRDRSYVWEYTLLQRDKRVGQTASAEVKVAQAVAGGEAKASEPQEIERVWTLNRYEMVEIGRALEENGVWPSVDLINSYPELGGFSTVLQQIGRRYRFGEPRATTSSEGEAVWRIDGMVASEGAEEAEDMQGGTLPMPTADEITVFLGQEDLFPRRIDFRQTATTPDGQVLPATLMTMRFLNLQLNYPVNEDEEWSFADIVGPDIKPRDCTEYFIRRCPDLVD